MPPMHWSQTHDTSTTMLYRSMSFLFWYRASCFTCLYAFSLKWRAETVLYVLGDFFFIQAICCLAFFIFFTPRTPLHYINQFLFQSGATQWCSGQHGLLTIRNVYVWTCWITRVFKLACSLCTCMNLVWVSLLSLTGQTNVCWVNWCY